MQKEEPTFHLKDTSRTRYRLRQCRFPVQSVLLPVSSGKNQIEYHPDDTGQANALDGELPG